MKILKYCQRELGISRRAFTSLVDEGKVVLNGEKIVSYGAILSSGDILTVSGKSYPIMFDDLSVEKQKLLLFNKPVGYVVSKDDQYNKTIYSLLPKQFQEYYYIGRLDKNSSGLLLMTNSPELVHQFEHPQYEIEKEYYVTSQTPLSSQDIAIIKQGIVDEGEKLLVVSLSCVGDCSYRIVLHAGKKRHIRRIFRAVGNTVLILHRVREGKYELGDLTLGSWKEVEL